METDLYGPPLPPPPPVHSGGGEGKVHLNVESFTGIGGLGRGPLGRSPGTVPVLECS